ncbi:MAG TPA: serine hydrolase domain-containing protein, partial [Steroidobacteraceae bacterium]
RNDAPGCVVGVAQRGQLIYRDAFGMANIEHGVANTPATRMWVASITKHFTCAAALRLAAAGHLSLEDPIGRWVPELTAQQRNPTLRQLMSHTSGLRCYIDHAVFDGFALMPPGRPAALQCRLTEVNFPPGHGMAYSNAGFLLLTWAIERAAGRPLEEVLRDGLFAEAGLESTALLRWAKPVQVGVATTYQRASERAGRGWQHSVDLAEELFGDAGIVSTVDDLLRWAAYLRASTGPVSLDTLAGPTELANGLQSRYGLGLITKPWRGLRLIHHAGTLPGVTAQFLTIREEELDVVVLFNRPGPAVDLSQKLVAAVLPQRLEEPLPSPIAATYEALLGQYVAPEAGILFALSDLDGKLALSQFGGSPVPLEARAPCAGQWPFGADVGSGDMLFRAAPAGDIEYCDRSGWHLARRVTGAPMSAAEVVQAAPESYRSDCAAATLRFVAAQPQDHAVEKDAALEVVIAGEFGVGHYPAASVGPDLVRFWSPGLAPAVLVRLEREGDIVQRVVVSTPRTRATVFQRAR